MITNQTYLLDVNRHASEAPYSIFVKNRDSDSDSTDLVSLV